MISAMYPIIESAISNGLVSSTLKKSSLCDSRKAECDRQPPTIPSYYM